MITIESNFPVRLNTALLERAARLALDHESIPRETEVTIVLGNDEQLRDLNREYRDEDAATDVLSFPALEPDPETGASYLGDIVISVEHARRQAEAGGHSLEAEIQLLIVHGILHLCGHDHAEAEEKARMWAAQAGILGQLGLSDISISE